MSIVRVGGIFSPIKDSDFVKITVALALLQNKLFTIIANEIEGK